MSVSKSLIITLAVSTYIRDIFANAAEVFGTPPPASVLANDQKDKPRNEKVLEYYFDRKRIIDCEERPNDKGCWKCGHIGHSATKYSCTRTVHCTVLFVNISNNAFLNVL